MVKPMNNQEFWQGKRVFITGHTGFKGSWVSIWLHQLGANVAGYALEPPSQPSLFKICNIDRFITSIIGDVKDAASLSAAMQNTQPEIVIHMAAQPLVRASYEIPAETFATNVMGTVNLLEAVRSCESVKAVVNVTTDKCYENKEWFWGYRENESLGGYDPYSSSKACSELVTSAYRNSYFNQKDFTTHKVALASARAGNVIGGGDWAEDRLIPDCINALVKGESIIIRNPHAIRPWQHVLEPLGGYLTLIQHLYEYGYSYAESWNFGPNEADAKPVKWIVENLCKLWGKTTDYQIVQVENQFHEANYLKLDCAKANVRLNWRPQWNLEVALRKIVDWMKAYEAHEDMLDICRKQIQEYMEQSGKG